MAFIVQLKEGMRKIPATKKTILKRAGVVQLVKLERFGCGKELYGVTYPQKVGLLDGSPICDQFASRDEALRAFDRYSEFFSKREARQ